MKKALFAGCSLFLSSLTFGQASPLPFVNNTFWLEGETVTLFYSNAGAPASVSNALMLQVLADIEGKLDGLDVPDLEVAVETNVRNTNCDGREHNKVLVCWERIEGGTATPVNLGGLQGTTSWRDANVVLDTQTTWTRDSLYTTLMHQLMHVLGFQHPVGSGTSVLNGAADITPVDTAGLQALYSSRCVLSYDAVTKNIYIPYVTYKGGAYEATIHHNGGTSFSLGTVAALDATTNPPETPCHNIAVDGNNQFRLPAVNVAGTSLWGDFQLQNGALTLTNSGRN